MENKTAQLREERKKKDKILLNMTSWPCLVYIMARDGAIYLAIYKRISGTPMVLLAHLPLNPMFSLTFLS